MLSVAKDSFLNIDDSQLRAAALRQRQYGGSTFFSALAFYARSSNPCDALSVSRDVT